jgi:dipeptidyl aminopeptidase/acylaminoacyl peptidase
MKKTTPARRAGTARACVPALALISALLAVHAPASADSLKSIAAQNATLAAAPALTLEDLSRRSRLREVKISPDGSKIAYLASEGANVGLYVMDVKTRAARQLLPNAGRVMLHWAGDGNMLFLDSPSAVSAVSLTDGVASKLLALDNKIDQRMLAVDPSNPQKVLVEEHDRTANMYRVFRIGADGKREPVYENQKKVRDLLVDSKGEVSFIKTLDTDYSQVVSQRKDGKWVEVTRCKPVRTCTLISASADGSKLTMAVPYKDDRRSLVQFDTASKAASLLHADPAGIADLGNAVQHPRTQQVLMASYDLPTRRNFGLTPVAQKAAADISKKFGQSNITVQPADGAAPWLMVETAGNLSQERYWLYDQSARSFTEILADERLKGKPLPEQQLAAKHPVSYKTADGLTVHGYVTLPPGRDAAKVPMVAMVHGGPWSRFDSEYHSLVQWMANRGVAVFQPNFRASTGYGDRFMLAAGEDFGNGRVQKDIIEGVQYLVANGIGDKRKLAIMGDSFGGYSTLQGLTHTPDMFQFGFAMVPPPEFSRTMVAVSDADKGNGDSMPFGDRLKEMGIRFRDAAAMKPVMDGSPAANATKITKPLVILAGAKDDKVEIAAVTAYVAQLQALNRDVTLLVDPDEGHNPRKPVFRQAYLHLLDTMMNKHLGTPAPAAPSPELAAYLKQTMK